MRVKIIDVRAEQSKNIITFSTEFGIAQAVWEGYTPEVGKEYFVEFEIAGVLEWGKDIVKAGNTEPVLKMKDNLIYLFGSLESVDEDGYTVIRLGDHIVPLDTKGVAYPKGTFVEIRINMITLYDIF